MNHVLVTDRLPSQLHTAEAMQLFWLNGCYYTYNMLSMTKLRFIAGLIHPYSLC